MNPKVDAYLNGAERWRPELTALRAILCDSGMTEDLKWGKPCYSLATGNVVALAALKDVCWLMFFKGALLDDPDGILRKAGENSQSMRMIHLTSVAQIAAMAPALRAYIDRAIAVEQAGLKVPKPLSTGLVYPAEFVAALDENPDLRAAFEALTPGRRRAYTLFFTAPKQSKTRAARIAICLPRILDSKGLDDR